MTVTYSVRAPWFFPLLWAVGVGVGLVAFGVLEAISSGAGGGDAEGGGGGE